MTTVSIIIPCYNEEKHITNLLDGIQTQGYPLDEIEVIIADGFSMDQTRQKITEYKLKHPELTVHLVDNVQRTIPSGLNTAIRAAQGTYIIRLDAHSIPQPFYIHLCIEALKAGKGDNVGGIWVVKPSDQTWMAKSIAAAGSHPLAVGDASYRYANKPAYVDTVPFGSYRKDLLDKIGLYDETLLSNEDYEFNTRIRKAGGKVWMDPAIQSVYFARGSLANLAKQYWRYGYWKVQMLRRYPETIRYRQALPPLFIGGMFLLAILSFFSKLLFTLFGIFALVYLLILLLAGIMFALQKRELNFIIGLPLAIIVMHFCWGGGFWWSLISMPGFQKAGNTST